MYFVIHSFLILEIERTSHRKNMKFFASITLFFLLHTFATGNYRACREQEYNVKLDKIALARQFRDDIASIFFTPVINLFSFKPTEYTILENNDIVKEICDCVLYKALTVPNNDYPKTRVIPVVYDSVSKDCQSEMQTATEIYLPGIGKTIGDFRIYKCQSDKFSIGVYFLKGNRVRGFYANAYDIYVADIPRPTNTPTTGVDQLVEMGKNKLLDMGKDNALFQMGANYLGVEKKADELNFQGFIPGLDIDKFKPATDESDREVQPKE